MKQLFLMMSLVVAVPAIAMHNPQKNSKECTICLDKKPATDMAITACGHTNCKECLKHILKTALTENKSTETLRCPDPECARKFDHRDIDVITAGDDVAYDRFISAYHEISTKEALATQPGIKQCPTPNCSYQFINDQNVKQETKCPQCKKKYCANCLVPHDNKKISCETVAANKDSDKKFEEWKKEHAKPCPKCKAPIEKNDGCDHMTCRKPGCGYEFCWVCLAPYRQANGGVHNTALCAQHNQLNVHHQNGPVIPQQGAFGLPVNHWPHEVNYGGAAGLLRNRIMIQRANNVVEVLEQADLIQRFNRLPVQQRLAFINRNQHATDDEIVDALFRLLGDE